MSNIDVSFAEELAEAVIVPPDGGYGWVVVFASFACNVIVDGTIFTCGSGFLPEFEKYYGVTGGTAAWAVSILTACYLCVGPVVSALANIFGCRKIVIAGSILASLGFILSLFAPNITTLYLSFGLMGGIGLGFIFMPSVVMVSYYFEKRRALATGIAVCGSGIGTFAFAPLIRFLLQEYLWQSALLIMSGVVLNCAVFGMFFRELEAPKSQLEHLKEMYEDEIHTVEDDHQPHHNHSQSDHRRSSMTNNSVSHHLDDKHALHRRRSASKSFIDHEGRMRHYSLFSIPEANDQYKTGLLQGVSQQSLKRLNRPMARSDIFYGGSVVKLPEYQSQKDVATFIASTYNVNELDTGGGLEGLAGGLKNTLRDLLDLSLLKSPSFLILCLSGFLTLTGFFVPFVYLPRHAEQMGHDQTRANFLISVLGAVNIFSRILCGWMSDHPKLDALQISNVSLTAAGLATMLVPHFKAYWLLCLYCLVFGFGTACFASLRSIICVELLGLEKLTNAYGLMLLFLGVASLIGSPLAGFLRDMSGNYNLSFYITGCLVMLSGLVGFPLGYVNRWEKSRSQKKPPQNNVEIPITLPDTETELIMIPTAIKEEDPADGSL